MFQGSNSAESHFTDLFISARGKKYIEQRRRIQNAMGFSSKTSNDVAFRLKGISRVHERGVVGNSIVFLSGCTLAYIDMHAKRGTELFYLRFEAFEHVIWGDLRQLEFGYV